MRYVKADTDKGIPFTALIMKGDLSFSDLVARFGKRELLKKIGIIRSNHSAFVIAINKDINDSKDMIADLLTSIIQWLAEGDPD